MTKLKHHRGTNGGAAYQKKCRDFALSMRFHVELAYLMEGSYSGAARELNRKCHTAMKGGVWFPATVQRTIELYEQLDQELAEALEKEADTSKAAKETIRNFKCETDQE